MGKEEKVITANEYRKSIFKEFEVRVPSGAKFKIKRLSPIDFIKEGMEDLPNPFIEFVQSEGTAEKLNEALKDKETKDFFNDFIKIIISEGIITPKVLIKYDKEKKDECLFWGEISASDQSFLISSIIGMELK